MIKEFKLSKDVLISSVMTLITVLIWTGSDVYRVFHKTTISKVSQEQMKPLDPKIKKEVIEELKSNLSFSEEMLNKEVLSKTPMAPIEEPEIATQSANAE